MKKIKPPPEELRFKLDQLTINGWYFQAAPGPAKAVVLFFHGNGQNRSAHFLTLYEITRRGYDLAIFDYPGYGQTGGTPTPESTVKTAMAAIREISQRNPKLPLVVFGQSLGGAIALRALWELRQEIRPSLIVVDSTFISYRSVARAVSAQSAWIWALQPVAWLVMSDRWAPTQKIKELQPTPM